MKKAIMACSISVVFMMAGIETANAQLPIIAIIKGAVKKVIKAVDLKIQRQQNKVIWLQNAQKTLENKMQELKLGEITGWVEKQRKLYADYFEELRKVKAAIAYYHRVRDIINSQVQLVNEYKRASSLFKQDKHFSVEEISYMESVYSGILDASLKNLEQLYLVINSFSTQMTDAKRIELIHQASNNIEQNLQDLRQFSQQNIRLSLARSRDEADIEMVKTLYGIK